MFGAWLTFPEMAFFLWFVVGLLGYIDRRPRRNADLSLYMMAGAIATVAAGLIATTLQIVIGIVPVAELGPQPTRALYVGWLASGVPLLFMPLALVLFVAARGMSRIESAPSWLAWLGYAAAAASVLGTITTFYGSGVLALNGPVGYFAFFMFAVWIVSTSIHLIKRGVTTGGPT